ncbi:MAG: hypothetical protein L6R40_004983 [Gallowayella cf. fulva]|nr:MAG: hypothetical protein L6R40_004983 [Xanthomendoza cf. fulva]
MMNERFIHAPLNSPSQLIDVGCGTGAVTRQLGHMYPTARVYGIDLSPVPTGSGHNPPNVEDVVGDVRQLLNEDARLAPASTDFIFSRLLLSGITDWPGYVRDMTSLLRPGGWAEMQDLALDFYVHGRHCSGECEWLKALFRAAQEKDWNLLCVPNIQGYMQQAGLVDISVKEYRLPLGTWLAGERPETKSIRDHAGREYGMLYYHAIPKMLQGLGYTKDKLEEFQRMTIQDWAAQEGKEMRFYATIGRKP